MKAFFKYLAVFVCGTALGIIISFVVVFKEFVPKQPSVGAQPVPRDQGVSEKKVEKDEASEKTDKKNHWFADKMKADAESRRQQQNELEQAGQDSQSVFDKFANPNAPSQSE